MEGKLRQGVKRAVSRIQSASMTYANSKKTQYDMKVWLDECNELLNYLARNYVSRDDYEWIKKRFDYREAEEAKQGDITKYLEKVIDNNRFPAACV
jgi:hypothetical protein